MEMSMTKHTTGPIELQQAPADLRPEVVSLARELERLSPGNYLIRVTKPDLRGLPWLVEISHTEVVRIIDLFR